METVLYLVSNLLHTYAIYILCATILGKSKLDHYIEILSFLPHYILNSAGYLIYNNTAINVATNIFPLIIILLQYKKSFGYKIFCVFSSCALGMFIDLLIFCTLPHDSILIKNSVVQNILLLLLIFVIKHFIKNKETDLQSNHIWFIAIIALGTISIGLLTVDTFNPKNVLVAIILMLINFLNFYMYDRDLKNLQMQHTLKLIETSNHAYQNQLNIMNESQQKIRFFKHDMKNHMYKLKKFILNNEYYKAVEYIEEMAESMSVNNEYVDTGNDDVDCLLNYKLSKAKEMGAEFSCDIFLPEDLVVTSFDMTTILGNLLDNSLNALKNIENKQLNISIKYFKGTIHIRIQNTYCNNIQDAKDNEHGLGLLSVKQALEKYHGIIDITRTDKKYNVYVFMYNSLE